MDIRIIAPRAMGERMAKAVGGRAYETRGLRDDVRVYVARASAADLRALADAIEAVAIRTAHGDPSA